MENKKLSEFVSPFKVLCTAYIITLLVGYAVSMLQIYDRSHFDLEQVVHYYRGDESTDENAVFLPQSFSTILSVSHVHTMSQPMLFSLLGFIFIFSTASNKTKNTLIILAFLGSLISNASAFFVRYGSGSFVFLFPLSQAMIAIGILGMSFRSLYELWFSKK